MALKSSTISATVRVTLEVNNPKPSLTLLKAPPSVQIFTFLAVTLLISAFFLIVAIKRKKKKAK